MRNYGIFAGAASAAETPSTSRYPAMVISAIRGQEVFSRQISAAS